MMKLLFLLTVALFPMSSFRLGTITYFDVAMMISIIVAATTNFQGFLQAVARNKWPLIYLGLTYIAVTISAMVTNNIASHTVRSLTLIISLGCLWTFTSLLAALFAGELSRVLVAMLVGASANAVAVIAQGQFGLGVSANLGFTVRMVGFAEHPIEAGYISAFAIAISAWGFLNHKNPIWLIPLILNIYSYRFSASMTAIFAAACALVWIIFYFRSIKVLAAIAAIALLIPIIDPTIYQSFIFQRVVEAFLTGGDYETVNSRIEQNVTALSIFDNLSYLTGRGFSDLDTVMNTEIHNGFIASIYHFGVLGLTAQLIVLIFIVYTLWRVPNRHIRALGIAFFLCFFAVYLTGPALSRRSLWLPVATVTMFAAFGIAQRRNMHAQNKSAKPGGRRYLTQITSPDEPGGTNYA